MVTVGIHLFMALYGSCVFSETPKRLRKGRMRYIIASVIITCITAFAASLDMAVYFQVLFASTSPSHWRTLMVNKSSGWEAHLSGTCVAVLVWIGDALLVYRCYAVWSDHSWVAALPASTSACALVLNLLAIFAAGNRGRQYVSAYIVLTVLTNVIVTGLIVFRLIRARRVLLTWQAPTKDIQLYTGAMAILIESALPLSIFGILSSGMMLALDARASRPPPTLLACYNTFNGLFFAFCTLSPHMIIFRVTIGRSFVKFSSVGDAPHVSTLNFGHQPDRSSAGGSFSSDHDEAERHVKIDLEGPKLEGSSR
ncbi:hypothetical protein MD484_g4316, partial [Candolleomyces efflorescens]